MTGLEWLVLITGLGLGWGVVTMLTGQRKRPEAARPLQATAPETPGEAPAASPNPAHPETNSAGTAQAPQNHKDPS
jgi:hypothetical protein